MEEGVEGTVRLRVLVAPDGTVQQVDLAASSGDPRLDAAAREAAWRWRYRPRGSTAWVERRVTFRLD